MPVSWMRYFDCACIMSKIYSDMVAKGADEIHCQSKYIYNVYLSRIGDELR